MNKKNSICFVAGRSGGHLIPALTLARNIRNQEKNSNILFFSTNSPLDKKIMAEHAEHVSQHISISLQNFPYKKIHRYPRFVITLAAAWLKSLYYLIKNRPKRVVSMGGYISIPVCLAAYLLRIKIELYELNATPGKATQLLAPFAHTIYVCFQEAQKHFSAKKCILTNYPIRFCKEKQQLHDPYKKTLLILGGSQGSLSINNLIKDWLQNSLHMHEHIKIIHQTGSSDTTDWKSFYKTLLITAEVFDFQKEITPHYLAADLVICRSGAGTLFETIFFEKKFITIPLETAITSHQLDNAIAICKQFPHLAIMLREQDIRQNNNLLFHQINHLLMPNQRRMSSCKTTIPPL